MTQRDLISQSDFKTVRDLGDCYNDSAWFNLRSAKTVTKEL